MLCTCPSSNTRSCQQFAAIETKEKLDRGKTAEMGKSSVLRKHIARIKGGDLFDLSTRH